MRFRGIFYQLYLSKEVFYCLAKVDQRLVGIYDAPYDYGSVMHYGKSDNPAMIFQRTLNFFNAITVVLSTGISEIWSNVSFKLENLIVFSFKGPNFFAKNYTNPTIIPKKPTNVLGQRTKLSSADAMKINKLYHCENYEQEPSEPIPLTDDYTTMLQ